LRERSFLDKDSVYDAHNRYHFLSAKEQRLKYEVAPGVLVDSPVLVADMIMDGNLGQPLHEPVRDHLRLTERPFVDG
jgi:hypothetical protein